MNDMQGVPGKHVVSLRWLTRALSIVVSGVFLVILLLAVTNEDKPQPPALPVLALLGLTMVATIAAWRWEKVGGLTVVFLALCLTAAAYSASRAFVLGSQSLLPALIYGMPFVAVGTLFWLSGRT